MELGTYPNPLGEYGTSSTNQPPTANAGSNQSVAALSTVTLDGSNSTDGDGTIVSYLWEETTTTGITIANANSAIATITTGESTQVYSFRLTVTDDDGESDTATMSVTSTAIPQEGNIPPVSDAGDYEEFPAGTKQYLKGNGSYDLDGTITTYSWSQLSGETVTIEDADKAVASITTPSNSFAQDLSFTLTVTDDNDDSDVSTVKFGVLSNQTGQYYTKGDLDVLEDASYSWLLYSRSKVADYMYFRADGETIAIGKLDKQLRVARRSDL